MKSFLSKLTALAFVAISSVHAYDSAEDSDVLRGSAPSYDEALVELDASCSQGTRAGRRQVQRLWRRSGENCDNVWSLADDAGRLKDRSFPRRPRDRREREFNNCARDEIDKEVKRIEKECLEDDSSQCEDLGDTAAEIIVFDNVCSPMFDQASSSRRGKKKNYKRTCRKVAYGICEGQISRTIRSYCPDSRVSTSKLRDLQRKCKQEVDEMTGEGKKPGDNDRGSTSKSSKEEFATVEMGKGKGSSSSGRSSRSSTSKSSKDFAAIA